MATDSTAGDSWYYIDLSGKEQGPHPLAHMRHCEFSAHSPTSPSQIPLAHVLPRQGYQTVQRCMCAGVEHGLIPATTQVKPSPSAMFQPAGSFAAITTGLAVARPPVSSTGTRDEAHDRIESSMAKTRSKRASRGLPSKRGPGTTAPRKLRRADTELAARSATSTPADEIADTSWWLLAALVCATATGVSAYVAWHGSAQHMTDQ